MCASIARKTIWQISRQDPKTQRMLSIEASEQSSPNHCNKSTFHSSSMNLRLAFRRNKILNPSILALMLNGLMEICQKGNLGAQMSCKDGIMSLRRLKVQLHFWHQNWTSGRIMNSLLYQQSTSTVHGRSKTSWKGTSRPNPASPNSQNASH